MSDSSISSSAAIPTIIASLPPMESSSTLADLPTFQSSTLPPPLTTSLPVSSTETSSLSTTSSSSSEAPTTSLPPTTTASSTSTEVSTSASLSAEVTVGPGGITRIQTRTIFQTASNSPTSTATPLPAVAPKSFFDNTGAVAGTFTAVGVVVAAVFLVLLIGIIRRRRANKFDVEVEEAAREARATRHPVALDYDDDDNNGYKPYPTRGTDFQEQPYRRPQHEYAPYVASGAGMAGMGAGYDPEARQSTAPYPVFAAAAAGMTDMRPRRSPGDQFVNGGEERFPNPHDGRGSNQPVNPGGYEYPPESYAVRYRPSPSGTSQRIQSI